MDWTTYQKEALKTAPDHDSPEERMMQALLGLVAESRELAEQPGLDELGDICWYYALLADAVDELEPHSQTPRIPSSVRVDDYRMGHDDDQLNVAIAWLCNQAEKKLFQDGADIGTTAANIGQYIRDTMHMHEHPPSEVYRWNIDKLRDRHGESWSSMDEQDRGDTDSSGLSWWQREHVKRRYHAHR